MPLVNLQQILEKANAKKYAVANFDFFTIEMLKGVIAAAEETRAPVILAYGEGFESYVDLEGFTPLLISAAKKATVPVAIHLDHAVNYEYILRAIHCGFTSVMVDASDRPLEENIAMTQKVIEAARVFDVSVEAEIGHVSGLGDLYGNDEYVYTDVEEARRFVAETNVDALAMAIGTVHGVYKAEPKLNFERLKEIKQAIKIPLVLHGGSGLSDDDFRKTIAYGVNKINIFTDLTLTAMKRVRDDAKNENLSYMEQCANIADAVKQEAMKKITLFGSAGKAD